MRNGVSQHLSFLLLTLLCAGYSVNLIYFIFVVLFFLKKKGTLIRSLCYPSVCLSVRPSVCRFVKTLYLRNAWRYRIEIQTIYSDLRPHDFLIRNIFLYLLRKKIWPFLWQKKRISTL